MLVDCSELIALDTEVPNRVCVVELLATILVNCLTKVVAVTCNSVKAALGATDSVVFNASLATLLADRAEMVPINVSKVTKEKLRMKH